MDEQEKNQFLDYLENLNTTDKYFQEIDNSDKEKWFHRVLGVEKKILVGTETLNEEFDLSLRSIMRSHYAGSDQGYVYGNNIDYKIVKEIFSNLEREVKNDLLDQIRPRLNEIIGKIGDMREEIERLKENENNNHSHSSLGGNLDIPSDLSSISDSIRTDSALGEYLVVEEEDFEESFEFELTEDNLLFQNSLMVPRI